MIRLGYQENEIEVFSRRTKTLSSIGNAALRMVDQLKRRDLQDSRAPSDDGVSFGTMHRAKGLEFKAVAVIGSGIALINQTPQTRDEAEASESCAWWKRGRVELKTWPRRSLMHSVISPGFGPPDDTLDEASSNSLEP